MRPTDKKKKMKLRGVYMIFLTMVVFAVLTISMFYIMLDTTIQLEHDRFVQTFEEYRFVPENFKVSRKSTYWARNIIVDNKEKQLFCITPHSFKMGHILEMLVKNLTSCPIRTDKNAKEESEIKKEYLRSTADCYFKLPFYDTNYDHVWEQDIWRKTVFVECPIQRFMHNYHSHCISDTYPKDETVEASNRCFNCAARDLKCFVDHIYDNYVSFLQSNTFKEFWAGEADFYPQFWSCGLEKHYLKYHYVKNAQEVSMFLQDYLLAKLKGQMVLLATGWGPQQSEPIVHEYSDADAKAVREQMEALSTDTITLQKLVTVYAIDFVAFNLELPTWVQQACPKCLKTAFTAAGNYRDAYFKHNSKAYTYLGILSVKYNSFDPV